MGIVLGVAADTFDRWHLHMRRLFMTRLTQRYFVRAQQRKIRHLVMIERRLLPVTITVAFFAFRSVFTLMAVILLVATIACHGRFLDAAVRAVAADTSGAGMGTQQRKTRFLCMVEFSILPTTRGVAVRACGSSCTLMRVIFRVAGYTGFLGLSDRIVCAVATCTSRSRMLAK